MSDTVDGGAGDEPTLVSSRPRFAPIPERLLLDREVSDGAVRLWGILDRVAARHRLWPGREYLAERLGVSTDTVDRRVGQLRAGGWLEVRRRGQGRTNLYSLVDRPESAAMPSPESADMRTQEAAPVRSKREGAKREEVSDTRAADEAFALWWAQYPRKVGKPAARKAWKRALGKASVAELGAGLEGWAAYWQARDEPEFVPYPATWLNQERWNDEAPVYRPRGSTALGVLDQLEDDWSLARQAASIEGTATERLRREVEP
jgi:hypothetical protein